jgi:hypothetical protein
VKREHGDTGWARGDGGMWGRRRNDFLGRLFRHVV